MTEAKPDDRHIDEEPTTLGETVATPLTPEQEAEKIREEGEPGGANFV